MVQRDQWSVHADLKIGGYSVVQMDDGRVLLRQRIRGSLQPGLLIGDLQEEMPTFGNVGIICVERLLRGCRNAKPRAQQDCSCGDHSPILLEAPASPAPRELSLLLLEIPYKRSPGKFPS